MEPPGIQTLSHTALHFQPPHPVGRRRRRRVRQDFCPRQGCFTPPGWSWCTMDHSSGHRGWSYQPFRPAPAGFTSTLGYQTTSLICGFVSSCCKTHPTGLTSHVAPTQALPVREGCRKQRTESLHFQPCWENPRKQTRDSVSLYHA